jgi:histidine ammonia-lyase
VSESFKLTPGNITKDDLALLLNQTMDLQIDATAMAAVKASNGMVADIVQSDKTVYGINTGLGALVNERVTGDELAQLQKNLVYSHATGVGEPLPPEIVRTVILFKINSLARGFSGVRPAVIDTLCDCYRHEIYPVIPCQGSVGASGDLAPLAHLTLALIGDGSVYVKDAIQPAAQALAAHSISPLTLAPKEGLALVNGLQFSAAVACHAWQRAEHLWHIAVKAGALALIATSGNASPFAANIQNLRNCSGQQYAAECYRDYLKDATWQTRRVQDPYSLRCQPQVMGACYEQVSNAMQVFLDEANAVSDNPLMMADSGEAISAGNFHGARLAMAADNCALAIAEMGALSERRLALLMDNHHSGLPPFLARKPGVESGLMLSHVTATALTCENKTLSTPHSIHSLPTSANQEDHVSMSANAAWRLMKMLDNLENILAIELLAANQALMLASDFRLSQDLQHVWQSLSAVSPAYTDDRVLADDIAKIRDVMMRM